MGNHWLHIAFLYKTAKIVRKRWTFISFSGHYSDNPKYLSKKLHDLDPSIEIVWCVNAPLLDQLPRYVIGVEYGTMEAHKYIASAAVIIDNVYGGCAFNIFGYGLKNKLKSKLLKYIFCKNGQRIYTTWHGTPLKKMGRDQIGNNVTGFVCGNIKMVLGNQYTLNIMKHLTFGKIPMKLLGTPRNDILFDRNVNCYKNKLHLPLDKKVFLFAPTFRNDGLDTSGKNLNRSGIDQLEMIDIDYLFEALQCKFGGDWVMVCRFHYHVSDMVNWDELDKKYDGRVINGNLSDDMAEYLVCADILMTDASSCMFDYIITGKPCFLFFPDVDNYENRERGFYYPIKKLPFPISVNFKELLDDISDFDYKDYSEGVNKLKSDFGYYEDGESSERILKWIIEDVRE